MKQAKAAVLQVFSAEICPALTNAPYKLNHSSHKGLINS
jgi:hypothetical protein